MLLVAASCSSCGSTLPAVCPFHDNTKRAASQDPAHPHLPAETFQRLELPQRTLFPPANVCVLLLANIQTLYGAD